MPVQTHPRLEAETVPRAEARQLHGAPGEQARDLEGLRGRGGYLGRAGQPAAGRGTRKTHHLEPVLARVPAPGDVQVEALDGDVGRRAKCQMLEVVRRQPLEVRPRFRP